MSVQPRVWPQVPPETARIARKAFRKGSLAIRIRDELGGWCADEEFVSAYGVRGRPGISPAQLAVVTVLAFTEDLTDRQAADAVRARLDRKYCLGLALDDEGFDFSVLSQFRSRLVAGGLEIKIFELLLGLLKDKQLVGAGGRQRTDSTHVLAALRSLNRLELAGETLRAALEALAAAAPQWLATVIDESWTHRYGTRIQDLRLPEGQAARAELAVAYARDGYHLLDAVDAAVDAPTAPGWLVELPAVVALRRIWIQQYYRSIDAHGGQEVVRREAQQHGLPPGRTRLISPYDLDARYSEKRGSGWIGYKVHLTETCPEPATDPATDPGPDPATDPGPGGGRPAPNLITAVVTTAASVPDVALTEPIHDLLDQHGVVPAEHVVDAGYTSADLLLAARARGITLLGPLLADTSPQARSGGYTTAAFDIDYDSQQATCPAGATSASWSPCTKPTARHQDTDVIVVKFATTDCADCPLRQRCTTSRRGRQLTVRPREVHQAVAAARAEQTTDSWANRYKIRAGVEATMRQATHTTGIRRARYTGLAKTRLEHALAATALNLLRLDAWWTGHPLDRTRTSHLQRLRLTLAA